VIRAVLDTNLILSALLWRGIPGQVLDAGIEELYRSAISEPILAELTDVLSRDKFSAKIHERGFIISEAINKIRLASEVIIPVQLENVLIRDPKDVILIECAVAGQVDYLVSGDKDLTSLKRYGEVNIVTPAQFLEIISSK